MIAFRIYLVVALAAFIAFNVEIYAVSGPDFTTPFLQAFASRSWLAGATADFMILISLAALWIGWRHGWSLSGWVIALVVFAGGSMALVPYVLFQLHRARGDLRRVLLGVHGPS